jgi:integrase
MDIERLRASLSEDGKILTVTVNKELKILKRMCNLAIQRRYLPEGANPVSGIDLAKVASRKPRFIAPASFERILRATDRFHLRALFVLLYSTALRKNGVVHLTWDDLDFDARIVHVARHTAEGFVQAWEPKDHERREIPVPDGALALLQELRASAPDGWPCVFMEEPRWRYYRDRVRQGAWRRDSSHLINNLLRRLKTCCRRSGIGRHTLHDLRRSCITNWAKQGLPIHVVQQLAGHAGFETTRQYYLSVQEDDLAKARAVQEGIIGPMKLQLPSDPKPPVWGQKGVRGRLKSAGILRILKRTRQDSNLQPSVPKCCTRAVTPV